MLDNVGGANGSSVNGNSTYGKKSVTTVKTASGGAAVPDSVSVRPVQDSSDLGDARGTQNRSNGNIDNDKIRDAVDRINQDKRFKRTGCKFTYHEKSKRVAITLYDENTKEVIKEIPPEDTIKMLDKLSELAGLVIDEKM